MSRNMDGSPRAVEPRLLAQTSDLSTSAFSFISLYSYSCIIAEGRLSLVIQPCRLFPFQLTTHARFDVDKGSDID